MQSLFCSFSHRDFVFSRSPADPPHSALVRRPQLGVAHIKCTRGASLNANLICARREETAMPGSLVASLCPSTSCTLRHRATGAGSQWLASWLCLTSPLPRGLALPSANEQRVLWNDKAEPLSDHALWRLKVRVSWPFFPPVQCAINKFIWSSSSCQTWETSPH